ncbi:hypothetical protein ACFL6D_01815 [Spirochaetota bacterium]
MLKKINVCVFISILIIILQFTYADNILGLKLGGGLYNFFGETADMEVIGHTIYFLDLGAFIHFNDKGLGFRPEVTYMMSSMDLNISDINIDNSSQYFDISLFVTIADWKNNLRGWFGGGPTVMVNTSWRGSATFSDLVVSANEGDDMRLFLSLAGGAGYHLGESNIILELCVRFKYMLNPPPS